MAKETGSKTKLCPYKKIIEREQDGFKGKTTTNERFAPCAGERCMAYNWNGFKGKCSRLESGK
ncbi:MAG: hypothetical protein OSJ56_11505 [Prevotella sp.]|nr:hypothetical protein [Prevotella sp.]